MRHTYPLNPYKIEVRRSQGKWYWRILSHNGRILAHSEKYSAKGAAFLTAQRLAKRLKCKCEEEIV